MLRFAPKLMVVFLCATALAGCASTAAGIASLTGGDTAAGHDKKIVASATDKPAAPTDLDGGVRQAQLLRLSGQYDDAIKILSQLMLVASDDPRVVSEYGKTLTEKGRAQDAVEFLNRAIELSSNDWTLYSALGVSYDQLGNQVSARAAYEHALALRPNEASVLNNYALSRMLANDPEGARFLIAKAQAAGGGTDAKIAANIAMLDKLAPAQQAPVGVAAAEKPAPAKVATAVNTIASYSPPPRQPAPVAQNTPRPAPVAQNAPRVIAPAAQNAPRPAPQQMAAAPVASGVVMQAVPFDPYAGPVTLHPPRPKAVATAKPDNIAPPVIDIAPAKAADAKPDTKGKPAPIKTASKDAVPALRLTADARNP